MGNTTKMGITGFCKAGEFSSGRSAVQAQIYLKKNVEENPTPFSTVPTGTSQGQSELPVVAHNIGVTVISILPSYVGVTDTQIENCFKQTAIKKNDTTQTVEECFDALNIPYNTTCRLRGWWFAKILSLNIYRPVKRTKNEKI